ncbi:hypothetical protein ACFVIM_16955 [Streptomyces sp. NPDC057638]|uniref:hypothetical protein n=1 Tax=Streptomyces sp. NPDC057638 TaxID=3346190 RepID=UPI003698F4CD
MARTRRPVSPAHRGVSPARRALRLGLVGGITLLASLLVLGMCGTGGDGADGAHGDHDAGPGKARAANASPSGPPAPRLTVPAAFEPGPRWEVPVAAAAYAVSPATGRVAYLEPAPGTGSRLRALDAATGRAVWSGPPLPSPGPGGSGVPRLLSVSQGGRDYLVVWSFGRSATAAGDTVPGADALAARGVSAVSLDIHDAVDGTLRRVEVPWPTAPVVSGTGPGILIADGRTRNAVVDPATGRVTRVPERAFGAPRGCTGCRRLTEVRGLTARGLLLSGESGFWVRGGWESRRAAPAGADPASGVPTSVVSGRLVAKWRPARGRADARTHEIWAVHDTASGRPLAAARCVRPAIEPGEHPRAALSPDGAFVVAGHLAFDLKRRKGHCLQRLDGGAAPLTLTTVTGAGTAYGATSARGAADALAGGGTPVELDLTRPAPRPLALPEPHIRIPSAEVADVALFVWTDARDRHHLVGHARR